MYRCHIDMQARDALAGSAYLEATDSLSHQDCLMLTCTPCGSASSADSADTWRAITLRLTSAYPTEPPSLVVRTSKDSPHAPQVKLSVLLYMCMLSVYVCMRFACLCSALTSTQALTLVIPPALLYAHPKTPHRLPR